MSRCPMCLQHFPEPPRLSADAEAVMLGIQARKVRGEPVTVPGIAAAVGLTLRRAERVMDYLAAEGWLSRTAWGGIRVERWVPTPVKPVREWVVSHVPHGAEPPAGAEVSREGLGPHAAHIQGIAYREVEHG